MIKTKLEEELKTLRRELWNLYERLYGHPDSSVTYEKAFARVQEEVLRLRVRGRERLPDERKSVTHKFSIAGHEGYLTVGMYPDGRPGEMFIRMAKAGSIVDGLTDAVAIAVSVGLQQGVPVSTFVRKYINSRFDPSGFTTNPQIQIAKSITDYVFRWIGMRFCLDEVPEVVESVGSGMDEVIEKTERSTSVLSVSSVTGDDPICPRCGSLMQRTGICHTCPACGEAGGCG
jgi:ribonucleoside-diphosphate reductase alpha chain